MTAGGTFVKRVLALLCSVVLLAVSLCGCGTPRNANKTINIKLASEPATLDPQVAQGSDSITVISALYEGLCRLDSAGKAVPGAASSWQANSDSTEFTFNIRSDAVWNGNVQALISNTDDHGKVVPTPLTASDFVFAWQRALDAKTASPVCSPMMCIENSVQVHSGAMSADHLGVTAKDNHTLVVHLRYTCPEFPELTAQSVFMPCNQQFFNYAAGRYGMERATILGNGPFSIPNYGWDHGKSLTANRAETYKGTTEPLPAALAFTIGGDNADSTSSQAAVNSTSVSSTSSDSTAPAGTVQQLIAGKLDASALNASEASAARNAGLTVTSFQDTTVGLCFNASGIFKSADLRRAFVQVLHRNTLMNLLPAGAQRADDILPPAVTFGGQPYRNQVRSGQYLKQSATAASEGCKLLPKDKKITLLCTDETKALASEMLANWNQAFQTYFSLTSVDDGTLLANVSSGSYDAVIYPYTPVNADAFTALACFQSGLGGNFTQLKDVTYDKILSGSSVNSSQLAQAEKHLNDNAVFYPLYYARHFYGVQPSLTGVLYHPFGGGLDFHNTGKNS